MNFDEKKLTEIIHSICQEKQLYLDKNFIQQFTGSVLLLIPEAAAFLVENGLPDDDETIKKALLIVSDALRKLAGE